MVNKSLLNSHMIKITLIPTVLFLSQAPILALPFVFALLFGYIMRVIATKMFTKEELRIIFN